MLISLDFELISVWRRMEEQFILRVPPSVAQHIDRLLNESASSSDDKSLDLSFSGKIMTLCLIYTWLPRMLTYVSVSATDAY